MTLINDGAGNTLGKVGDRIISNPLPLSGVEPGSFKPCKFSWLHLTQSAKRDASDDLLEDDDGSLSLDEEWLASLDTYQMGGVDLIIRFEEAVNLAAELAVNLGYYYAVHDDVSLPDLISGVQAMQDAAKAAEQRLKDVFPAAYEEATGEDCSPPLP